MARTLVWLSILLVLALFAVIAWSRYRQHQRKAQARSLAALNRLLAEADEIAQNARQQEAEGSRAEGAAPPDDGGRPPTA